MANPNIAKLKKKATDFEQKKQFDRALSLYIQLLEEAGRDLDDADLQLFNRVGDLLQRQGNVSEALAYYEKAVDVYAERGFLNNAIALCNKILRQSPARTAVYYKLGKISASKGFKSDAKKNFLEYADRMQKAGHVDEAFRALKEFADLCPDQDDIRLMLAEWLNKENRKSEAIEQLEVLYGKLESEGRAAEARATIDRIKAIDPNITPKQSGQWQAQKSNDLIFLDLGGHESPAARRNAATPPGSPPAPDRANTPAPAAARVPALEGLILTFDPEDEQRPALPAAAALDGFEATATDSGATDGPAIDALAGLEAGGTPADAVPGAAIESILVSDVEASWTSPNEPIPLVTGLETPRVSFSGAHPALSPLIDEPPLSGREFASLELEAVPEKESSAERAPHDFALPSDLPLLDTGDAPIDLLSVMRTPVGMTSVAESVPSETAGSIDLLALPPLGVMVHGDEGPSSPVTGSLSPLDLDAPLAPTPALLEGEGLAVVSDEPLRAGDFHWDAPPAAADPAPEVSSSIADEAPASVADGVDSVAAAAAIDAMDAAADTDAAAGEPSRARADRDTSELIALDGTARATDEILIVPSEIIDEETKRSLRLEFSLDGEETPDAWVEAALAAPDDLSLDRFLTPLGVPAIVEEMAPASREPEAPQRVEADLDDVEHVASADDGSDAGTIDVAGLAVLIDSGDAAADDEAAGPHGASDTRVEVASERHEAAHEAALAEASAEAPAAAHEGAYVGAHEDAPSDVSDLSKAAESSAPWDTSRESLDAAVAADSPASRGVAADDVAPAELPDEASRESRSVDARAGEGARADDTTTGESPYGIPPLSLESIGAETPKASGDDVSLDADDLAALGAAGWDSPAELSDIDLLDELTPPFMRHDDDAAGATPTDERHDAAGAAAGDAMIDLARISALDVDALRAVVEERDTRDGHEGGTPNADSADVEAAFEETVVDLPLLDVDDLVMPLEARTAGAELDIEPFSVESLLSQPPSFGELEEPEFLSDAAARDASPASNDNEGSANEPVESGADAQTDASADDVAPQPTMARGEAHTPHEDELVVHGTTDELVVHGTTDEWPADAAPEVLIDGEWRDEHMGDLVSGEVSAIVGPSGDRPNRSGPRFDDLAAALMWPPPEGEDGEPSLSGGSTGASDAFFSRMHTPRSTLSFGGVEAQLRRRLELDPNNLALRRQLGEALLDQGDREEGLLELDLAMRGFEQANDLESARGVADIVLRVIPTSVRHHQKRVEYAVRSNDRVRLVEAYVELADSLFRSGEPEKARVVYSRVLELSPGNGRARFALGLLSTEEADSATAGARPVEGSIPVSPDYVVTLFDRTVSAPQPDAPVTVSSEVPVVSDSLFVAAPADAEPSQETREGDGASFVDVRDIVTQERERLVGDAEPTRDAPGAADAIASTDEGATETRRADAATDSEDDDLETSVAPFPGPSLDEEIDEAFATPPIVEALTDAGASGSRSAADYDFSGTPPLGAAALATPFSSDEIPGAPTPPMVPSAPASGAAKEIALSPSSMGKPDSAPETSDDDFIDLGSWLREDEPVRTTRMIAEDAPPTGDEQADFDEMLRRFKQGVAANVDEEDYDSHYDLGVAYKEMGLVDEAIAEFQKALRGDSHRVRSYEALGQCFVEKGQLQVATTLMRRALETTGADDQQLVGVLYLLGYASEVMARHADALGYYQRVFAVDIEFRDVAQRVAAMEHVTQ